MTPAGDPPGPRRSPLLRAALYGIGAIVLLVGVVAAVTIAIVLSGSTEIGIVRDRVQIALAVALGPDLIVDVGRAAMTIDSDLGLVVDLERITARDRAGAVVVSVPTSRLAVDSLALLGMSVVVTRAELAAPTLALVRGPDGVVRLEGAEAPGGTRSPDNEPVPGLPQLADRLVDADAVLGRILDEPALAHLDLTVTDGSVSVRDAVSGNVRRFEDIALIGSTDAAAGALTAELSARTPTGTWSASLARRVEAATGDRLVSLGFSQITLADVTEGLAGTAAAEIPLYGAADIVLDARGLRDASIRLDIGAGVLDLGAPDETVLLDEAAIRARWDGAAGEIVVEPSSVHFGPTGGSFTGVVRDEGGGRFMFAFESGDTVLASRDMDGDPLAVQLLELSGSADVSARRLDVDRLVVQTEQGSFAGAVRLGFTGETPSLAVAAELTPMDIATWKRMWPVFVAPGARRWALDNISAGRIAAARFDAAVPAGVLFRPEPPKLDAEQFRLDLRLEDVTVSTFGGLPPVSRASGQAVLAGATFGVDVASGEVRTPGGRLVAVDAGAFAIDDVFDPSSDGVVEVQLSGAADAIGELADAEPLHALARRDLVPADLSGTAEVVVSARVPLELAADDDVSWKVTARGTDLASRKPLEGRRFRDADVTIVVTGDAVSIDGTAEVDGVMAAVSLAQPLARDGSNAPGAQQAAALTLDRDARLRLGLDIEDIVSGTVDAQVRSLPDGAGEHYDLDLRRARLVLSGLGWSKEVGVPASMAFDLRPADGGSRIENMVLAGDGFGFTGTADVNATDGLVAAQLAGVHLQPGDDVAVTIARKDAGYAVAVDGASFDVRGVIAEMKGDGEDSEDGGSADVSVEARVRKLHGYGNRAINDAALTFVLAGDVPRQLTVNGKLGGAPLSLAYVDDLTRASLKATAGNAGAVLAYLDVYGRIGGGRLVIAGERPAPTGPLAGTIAITDFAILDEPAMREVVSRARPKEGETIDVAKMHAEEMSAVFRYTGNEIFVDDALLRGTSMGATFNGVFDLVRSVVTISGTYIPLFGINSAFSRLPVVGRILGGRNGEGLIGVTFKIEGPIDGPRVFVNPLSAVAPGILRKVFEFK